MTDMRKAALILTSAMIGAYGCSPDIDSMVVRNIPEISSIVDAIPKNEPYSRTGNDPYQVYGITYVPLQTAAGYKERGIASWYGPKFHGKKTSSGEVYDMHQMTAAHKTLPLPSYVSVTNLKNKKRIIVRVNDRGPFIGKRIIDLSYAAARKLDVVRPGTAMVEVKSIAPPGGWQSALAPRTVYLSAGTFKNKNNARGLKNKIAKMGVHDVRLEEITVSGSKLYQVRVGPFKSEKQANRIIKKLSSRLPDKPYLVFE